MPLAKNSLVKFPVYSFFGEDSPEIGTNQDDAHSQDTMAIMDLTAYTRRNVWMPGQKKRGR